MKSVQSTPIHFNPRPPRGGRRYYDRSTDTIVLFQSTPPARGATQARAADHQMDMISIHAPREGGDISGR